MVGSRWEPGRVGAFIDGFEARLLERGYTPGTVEQVLKYARQFGRWMTAADLEVWQVDESAVDAFLDSRAARRTRQVGTRNLGHLLDYLRSEGVVKPKEVPQPTPVEELVARHRSWLVDERGLASQTSSATRGRRVGSCNNVRTRLGAASSKTLPARTSS